MVDITQFAIDHPVLLILMGLLALVMYIGVIILETKWG